MQFIEPYFLWGALAVAIPVAIHFWHQKQGKPLPWAATQWLLEKEQQQSRGIRLDKLWLLIVRCLLLVVLAILLAQPLLQWASQTPTIQRTHLVQPSSTIVDNFRFELTEALKKGDRVVWANGTLDPATTDLKLPERLAVLGPLSLQTAVNQADAPNTELHLYISNNQNLADVPAITVPALFQLHVTIDSIRQSSAYLDVKGGRKLFINRLGRLVSAPTLDPGLKFGTTPVHSGPIRALISYKNPREQQTVKASVAALTDVYGLDLQIDEKSIPSQTYDWVLTDQLPQTPLSQTLYVVSGALQRPAYANVIGTDESLTPQTSTRVANGELPEWLGEQLLTHYGLDRSIQPLSRQDLNALFVPVTKPKTEQQASLQNGLFLLFIVLLVIERWMALTKNA
ncbi:hypothetical protein GCM10028805_50950 [Spirosoma harenae]